MKIGDEMESAFPGAVPEIPVSDLGAALAYYEKNLGFSIDWSDEELGLAGLSRGACRLFLGDPGYRNARGNVGPVMIWLNLDNRQEVEDLYRQWKAGKAELISEPESMPWGLHEFTAKDPDGNLFRVFYDFATGDSCSDV